MPTKIPIPVLQQPTPVQQTPLFPQCLGCYLVGSNLDCDAEKNPADLNNDTDMTNDDMSLFGSNFDETFSPSSNIPSISSTPLNFNLNDRSMMATYLPPIYHPVSPDSSAFFTADEVSLFHNNQSPIFDDPVSVDLYVDETFSHPNRIK